MKKIRYIPYGYTMRNGRTVISTEEAEIIREIFKAYVTDFSYIHFFIIVSGAGLRLLRFFFKKIFKKAL